jgi:transposase-like protein
MRTTPMSPKVTKPSAENVVKAIRRETRRQFSAEEKIRIVLEGQRGEGSISELSRRESIATSLYYVWSKEFLEAGKKRPRCVSPMPTGWKPQISLPSAARNGQPSSSA